jgi:hypothetical protein
MNIEYPLLQQRPLGVSTTNLVRRAPTPRVVTYILEPGDAYYFIDANDSLDLRYKDYLGILQYN